MGTERTVRIARAWAVILLLSAVWISLGPWLSRDPHVVVVLSKCGIVLACAAPLIFISVYTVLGLFGPDAKWWQEDIPVTLVLVEVAAVAQTAVLAWAFVFNNGILTSPALVWTYLGGLIGGGLIILWRTWIWIRISRLAAAQRKRDRVKVMERGSNAR